MAHHGGDGVGVAGEGVDVGLGPHIPHPSGGVSAAGDQHVNGGVQSKAIAGTQVAMVVTDYLGKGEGGELMS